MHWQWIYCSLALSHRYLLFKLTETMGTIYSHRNNNATVCNLGLLGYHFLQTWEIIISPGLRVIRKPAVTITKSRLPLHKKTLWYDNGGSGCRISSKLQIITRTPHSCEIWYSVALCSKTWCFYGEVVQFYLKLEPHIYLQIYLRRILNFQFIVHFRFPRWTISERTG